MRQSMWMLVGLAFGMIAGVLLPSAAVQGIEPVGALWFNAIRMTVVPIVLAQLILGINTQIGGRELGVLGVRAIGWFTGLLAATALFSACVMPIALRWIPVVSGPVTGTAPPPAPGLGEWVANLFPANLFQAAAEGRLLSLILFAIVFGAAVRTIAEDRKQALLSVVAGVSDAMLGIVGWLMRLAPFGVAALAVPLFSRLGLNAAGAFGYYILCFCSIEIAVTLAMYLLVLFKADVGILRWSTAVAPIQTLAFGSRSSMAALPAMVEVAERRLAFGPAITGFVLPLAAAIFRYSTPVSHVTGAFFLAHLYGLELSANQILLMVVTTVFLSIGTPGIPSGGLLVALPLFHQLGLPPEGLGILIAADAIPDMFKTMANVTAHMAVAAILARPGYTLGE